MESEPSTIEIEPQRLAARMAQEPQLTLIDVRERHEREAGYIEGSAHIELVELSARAAELNGAGPIVFYCRVGNRSLMAAQAVRAAGLEAYSLQGGLLRWAQEGRALVPPDGYVAEH